MAMYQNTPMEKLNLPEFDIKLKQEGDKTWVFDLLRKKYVVLTPEEWVRQHFLNYLTTSLGYPKSLMKVESGMRHHKLIRRTDILVYNREAKPFMLVECKAAEVSLNQAVFDQVSAYNQAYQAPHLVITNGLHHFCCKLDFQSQKYEFLTDLPQLVE